MYLDFKNKPVFRVGASDRGFTLVEVLVAVSLLGLLAGGSIWSLSQANNYAAVARLRTGAESVAQNRIDMMMTENPFNPQDLETPTDWTMGTGAATTEVIYSEPATALLTSDPQTVTGQMTTTVAKYVTPNINGSDLNVYTAVVTVQFTFRGKQYQVQLNGVRASDV